jgi:hypothetical protein
MTRTTIGFTTAVRAELRHLDLEVAGDAHELGVQTVQAAARRALPGGEPGGGLARCCSGRQGLERTDRCRSAARHRPECRLAFAHVLG